jgi:Flp pilus assembly pilin Flp
MHIKNKRGQSTVEYVLLITAVLVVIIAFVSTKNGGFQGQLNSSLNAAASDINSMGDKLSKSHDSTTAPTGATVGEPQGYSVNPLN